jgi:hypothetical protein
MLGIAAAAFTAGALLLLRGGRAVETPEEHAARLSREHGVLVRFGNPHGFYTPPYGPSDARLEGAEMEPANPENVAPALDGIEESLRKYPPGFVKGVAHGIFICGRLRFQGVDAGGTVGPAWIVLVAPSFIDHPSIRLTNLLGVHHELSSLVLARSPSNSARWAALSPSGWAFADDQKSSLRRADHSDPPPSTGFLSAYGATTPENDFNVYAEKMFTEPESVAQLARANPVIARKVTFVIASYAAIDRRMLDTFRTLGFGPWLE